MIENGDSEFQVEKCVQVNRGDFKVGDKVTTSLDGFDGFIGKIIEARFDVEHKLAPGFGSQLETVFLVDFGNGERLLLSGGNLGKVSEEDPMGYYGNDPKWEGLTLDGEYYKRVHE